MLHPFARQPFKEWPFGRMVKLGRFLVQKFGASVVVTGSKKDRERCLRLCRAIGKGAIPLAGEISLVELAWLISKADLVVSVDTGPMHIAAGLEVPLLTLFGPGSVNRWGPKRERAKAISVNPPCSPCAFSCRSSSEPGPCMKAINFEEVAREAERLLLKI